MAATANTQPEELIARVQDLQQALDGTADGETKGLSEELVSAVVQMYGAGLERFVSSLGRLGEQGRQLLVSLSEDPLVAALLLIHDLHPVPLVDRVAGALAQVRPYMESHGGDVELLSLDDGVARLRLRGSCSDCAASAMTLELAIKQALEVAAPDLEALEVEGVQAAQSTSPSGPTLPIYQSHSSAPAAPAPSWHEVERLEQLGDGEMIAAEVAGAGLVVANVDGTLLAYRDRCGACGAPLHDGVLRDGALSCPRCSRGFSLPRAGRSLDDERLQLEPVPLLRERDSVRVALTT